MGKVTPFVENLMEWKWTHTPKGTPVVKKHATAVSVSLSWRRFFRYGRRERPSPAVATSRLGWALLAPWMCQLHLARSSQCSYCSTSCRLFPAEKLSSTLSPRRHAPWRAWSDVLPAACSICMGRPLTLTSWGVAGSRTYLCSTFLFTAFLLNITQYLVPRST